MELKCAKSKSFFAFFSILILGVLSLNRFSFGAGEYALPKVILEIQYGRGEGEIGFYYCNTIIFNEDPEAFVSWNKDFVVDSKGNIYVPDPLNHKVLKFDKNGTFVMEIGKQTLEYPKDVEVDGNGNLYVADSRKFKIFKFNELGGLLLSFGSEGEDKGQFIGDIQMMRVSNCGNIYVKDYEHDNKFQKFDSRGTFLGKVSYFLEDIQGDIYTVRRDANEKGKLIIEGYERSQLEKGQDISDPRRSSLNLLLLPDKKGMERIDHDCLGFDKEENLYLRPNPFEKDEGTTWVNNVIIKYNTKQKISLVIHLLKDKGHPNKWSSPRIDIYGNIYQQRIIYSDPAYPTPVDKLQIFKWEKINK